MYCKNCRAEIDEKNKYCPECGEPTKERDSDEGMGSREGFSQEEFDSREHFEEDSRRDDPFQRFTRDGGEDVRYDMESHGLSVSNGPMGLLGFNSTLVKVVAYLLTVFALIFGNIPPNGYTSFDLGTLISAALTMGISYLIFSSCFNKASFETGIKLPDVPRKKTIWIMVALFSLWSFVSNFLGLVDIPFIGWILRLATFVLGFYLIYKIKDIVADILKPLVPQLDGRLAFGSAFRKRYIFIIALFILVILLFALLALFAFSLSLPEIQNELNNIL